MDSSKNPAPGDASTAVLGELVVGNGRLIATRKPLTNALTLVGEGSGCDVRLHSDKIAPFHCALFHGPTGFVLRNLGKRGETRVNGEAAETHPLRHGDRIDIGPYALVLELPGGGQNEELPTDPALEAEREAVRIQAAAVVAQQAELTEEELRLGQRVVGLERQEEQLAKHLEEKRRGLVEQREQVKAERDAWKENQAEEERRIAARHQEVEKALAEADEDRKAAKRERSECAKVRKDLQHRWDEHFAAHETELTKREAKLKADADTLGRERTAQAQQRLQYNGEMEIGRRKLEAARRELSLAQKEWEDFLKREQVEFERREHELAERAEAVARHEHELAEARRSWEQVQKQREEEAEGLETRIRNQRLKLQSLEQTAANLEKTARKSVPPGPAFTPSFAPERAAPAPDDAEAPVVLQRFAGCLADQRLHLLDQWRNVLAVQEQWQQQREALLTELEESGRRLAEREQLVGQREQHLTARAAHLDQRQEALAQLRGAVEGRQARFKAGAQEWEAERARGLAEVREREQTAAARAGRLESVCRRTAVRCRTEAAALEQARSRCEEARQQYAKQWEECRARAEALLAERQSLSGEALALEQLRLEILGKSGDGAAAEKRLERLRRQGRELIGRAEGEVLRTREVLRAEALKLEERLGALKTDEKQVLLWRRKLAKRQKAWDERTAEADQKELQRLHEVQRLQEQHEVEARHLQELRDEVERLARLMMEGEGEGTAPSSPLAA